MTMPNGAPAAPPADGNPAPPVNPPADPAPAPQAPAAAPAAPDAGQPNAAPPQVDPNGPGDPPAPATPPAWATMAPAEAMQHEDFADARQELEDVSYNRWRGDNAKLTQAAAQTQQTQQGIRESLQKMTQDVADAIADETFGAEDGPAVRTIMREFAPVMGALENEVSQAAKWGGIATTVDQLLQKSGITGGAAETIRNQVEDVRIGGSVDVLGNIVNAIGKAEFTRGRKEALAEVGEAAESNQATVNRHEQRIAANGAPPATPAGANSQRQYSANDLAGMTREQVAAIPKEQRYAALQLGQ